MQNQRSNESSGRFQRIWRFFLANIRYKIILPYLVLTIIVAGLGIYVVTRLVVGSLDDLLTNALLEAGRVVSDGIVNREIFHQVSARAIAFTVGLAEALQDSDREQVVALAQPVAVLRGLECFIVADASGQEVLHMLRQGDGTFEFVEGQFNTSELWMVRLLLESGDPNGMPKRGLVLHAVDGRYYYFTAIPVGLEDRVVGVVIVGTSLDTLLVHSKNTSLADVIIYLDGGRAVATTFAIAGQSAATEDLLNELSTTPDVYQGILYSEGSTMGEGIDVRGRSYRIARAPFRVGNDTLGAFAVALPLNYVIESHASSRTTYTLIFFVGMAGVIMVGYWISRRITTPLSRLVRTSQAVAEGNLDQRTDIVSIDEIGILAETFDEMTERLAERTHALEEAVGRLRAILSSIGDGVIMEDMEGESFAMNAAAENMLEEMAANFMLGPVRDMSAVDATEEGDQSIPWPLTYRRFEVSTRMISTLSTPVRTDDGEHLGTVTAMRDITDEVEAIRRAAEMEAHISHLEELDRQKNEFISIASHELRSPLASAKTFVQNLLDGVYGPLSDDQTSRLGIVLERVNDEIVLVNTLLDFSQLETQPRPIVRKPADVTTIIYGIVDEFRPRAEDKEIVLGTGILEAETVLIDKRAIWRVLSNLLDNALKFTPSGGRVTLSAQNRDEFVEIQVSDTGIGIPEGQLERIFDKFYQLDSSTTREFGGLGLGLAVAKEVVEQHSGAIWAKSQPGVGSVFHFTLPKAPV